jgi:hypothetical protein
MSNLTQVVQRLKEERRQLQGRIEQLDEALKALTGPRGVRGTARTRGPAHAPGKRRTMSAAARKRIAAAQRARWAKWKAAQRRKWPGLDLIFHPSIHGYFVFTHESCIDSNETTT